MNTLGVEIEDNLEEFSVQIQEYQRLSEKRPEDVLLKQGGKLAYALAQNLKGLAPAKGAVTADRLAALKRGEGVKVRPRIRQEVLLKNHAASDLANRRTRMVRGQNKILGSVVAGRHSGVGSRYGRMNLTALMVKRELAVRESGRGFLAQSAHYPRILQRGQDALSKSGVALSTAALRGGFLTFEWSQAKSELSGSAAEGLNKPRGVAALNAALREVIDDIAVYNARKQGEDLGRAFGQ